MTQEQKILDYLKAGGHLSQLVAFRLFGCWRLGARIYDLRRKGHLIETHFETRNGRTYAVYNLFK